MSSASSTPDKTTQLPPALSRRDWVKRVGILGLSSAASGVAGGALGWWARADSAPPSSEQRYPFAGEYQAGILTTPQNALIFASFHVLAKDKSQLVLLFKTLNERISFLTQGGEFIARDPQFPPLNSGILGAKIPPDGLTMTLAVGASLFDQRYGLSDKKPIHLSAMPAFSNDQLNPAEVDGDLSLQFCANSPQTCLHALRDVIKSTPLWLSLAWKIDGFLPTPQHAKQTPRNLLGFKDGTSNPPFHKDAQLAKDFLWTGESAFSANEPVWTRGGSYQVCRIIRNRVEFWDRTPLQEQQTIIGRDKVEGAPLGGKTEHEAIDYQYNEQIRPDAHIRLANPRTAESKKHLILRRGYNYSRGVLKSGQLDIGLVFICYQANLSNGFVHIQNQLNGEPLEEYITPVGGGYFFALPGLGRQAYIGESLLKDNG